MFITALDQLGMRLSDTVQVDTLGVLNAVTEQKPPLIRAMNFSSRRRARCSGQGRRPTGV